MDPTDTNSEPTKQDQSQPDPTERQVTSENSYSSDTVSRDEPAKQVPPAEVDMPEATPSQAVANSVDEGINANEQLSDTLPSRDNIQPQPSNAAPSPTDSPRRKHFWRNVVIGCGVLIVLLGGSAAAFFGIYLPSQPWYVLDTALKNTLGQTQFTANIVFNGNSVSKNTPPFQLTSISAVNLNNKAINENLSVREALSKSQTITIPIEATLVNNSLYFKINNASGTVSLLNNLSPNSSAHSLLNALPNFLLSAISNHWFMASSALLDQSSSLKCLLNSNWVLSNSDSNYLVNSYLKQPFLKVISTSNSAVNGVASEELSVMMNDNEAANYIKGWSNLQAFRDYQTCNGSKSNSLNVGALADGKQTPMTIWVDKSNNLIDKVSMSSNSSFNGSLVLSINYGKVNVVAPANAESVMQLFTQISQQALTNPQLQNTLSKTGL